VGLNQYGARGRALAGQTAPEILAHYYQGTALGTMNPATSIRVLVLDNFAPSSSNPLVIYGRNGTWTVTGVNGTIGADGRVKVYPAADGSTAAGRMVVETSTGTVLYDGAAPARIVVAPGDGSAAIQLWSKPTSYDLLRGSLTVVPSSTTIDVVNTLAIDEYLRGVLPAEMSSSWPSEALKAQAIAARSYAAYRIRASGSFDLHDDTRSQVYLGIRRETAATDAVVSATSGQVMYSGSSYVNALFHSTGGGATENNENVFVSNSGAIVAGRVSYLRGSMDRDPNGIAYDAAAPRASWATRAYSVAELSSIFGRDSRTAVGTLTGLDLTDRGVSGRLISVTLYGSSGQKTVSGNLFVDIFNAYRPSGDAGLWSTLLDVAPIP
jgi:stage II sporulation protein D